MECPICEAIESGKVCEKRELCAVIESPFPTGGKMIVAVRHEEKLSPDGYREAIQLASSVNHKGLIGDIPEVLGHWAVRLLMT